MDPLEAGGEDNCECDRDSLSTIPRSSNKDAARVLRSVADVTGTRNNPEYAPTSSKFRVCICTFFLTRVFLQKSFAHIISVRRHMSHAIHAKLAKKREGDSVSTGSYEFCLCTLVCACVFAFVLLLVSLILSCHTWNRTTPPVPFCILAVRSA